MTRRIRTGTVVTILIVFELLMPVLGARAAEPPTGVPPTTFTITDTCQSGPDNCGGLGPGVSITSSTFTVTSSYNSSTCTGTFNGTGATNGNPAQTQNIAGTVTGNKVSFTRT